MMDHVSIGNLQMVFDNRLGNWTDEFVDTIRENSLDGEGSYWMLVEAEDPGSLEVMERHRDSKVNLIVLITYTTNAGRELIKEAARDLGTMEKGFWMIPETLFDGDPDQIQSRFDSHIYLYDIIFPNETGIVNIKEVFSVKKKHKFTNNLATWTLRKGLKLLDAEGIWDRRQRFLEGVELRGVHLAWPPFTYTETAPDGAPLTYGILTDAIRLFQVKILYTILAIVVNKYQTYDIIWNILLCIGGCQVQVGGVPATRW